MVSAELHDKKQDLMQRRYYFLEKKSFQKEQL
jgi:hypothetical protein